MWPAGLLGSWRCCKTKATPALSGTSTMRNTWVCSRSVRRRCSCHSSLTTLGTAVRQWIAVNDTALSWNFAEEGPMAKQQELRSLRESCSIRQKLGASERTSETFLSLVWTGPRRHHVRPKGHSDFNPPRRGLKGQYVADLFSGDGGLAMACRKLGFAIAEWNIKHGRQCDLISRKVLRKLPLDIKSGKVLAAMLAPPCDSFLVAHNRLKVIRTRDLSWGLPTDELIASELEKVKLGNACFKSCFSIIRLLDRYRIPWILENPITSKCWYLPFFQSISI